LISSISFYEILLSLNQEIIINPKKPIS